MYKIMYSNGKKKIFSGVFCSGITGYPPGRNKIGIYLSPTQK